MKRFRMLRNMDKCTLQKKIGVLTIMNVYFIKQQNSSKAIAILSICSEVI